jgi:hypothetical protein
MKVHDLSHGTLHEGMASALLSSAGMVFRRGSIEE